MKRSELEHLIRAAGAISGDSRIIVIGSQSILGAIPDAPRTLRASIEADLYPAHKPELADIVDGSIGEGSRFHEEFGYYAQGVGPDTAILPRDWQRRLVSIKNSNTGGIEGLCLDVHDLAISKYVAGRAKDLAFTRELARLRLTRRRTLLERLHQTAIGVEHARVSEARIRRDFVRQAGKKR